MCVCKKGKIKVEIIEMVYQEFAEFPVRCGDFEITGLGLKRGSFYSRKVVPVRQ